MYRGWGRGPGGKLGRKQVRIEFDGIYLQCNTYISKLVFAISSIGVGCREVFSLNCSMVRPNYIIRQLNIHYYKRPPIIQIRLAFLQIDASACCFILTKPAVIIRQETPPSLGLLSPRITKPAFVNLKVEHGAIGTFLAKIGVNRTPKMLVVREGRTVCRAFVHKVSEVEETKEEAYKKLQRKKH